METAVPFVQLTFRGVPHRADLDAEVKSRAGHMTRFHPRIHGCWVVITKDAQRHQRGDPYRITVRVAIPGNDVVISNHPAKKEHEDPYVALADTFDTVERKLEEQLQIVRGEVKTHAAPPQE